MKGEKLKSVSALLHEKLKIYIASKEPGDRLPSEPKLAKQLGVSRATLREAMRIFETQGLIHRRQGVGTFVARPSQVIETGLEVLESIHTLADRIQLHVRMGDYKVSLRKPTEIEREKLELPEDRQVVEVIWAIEAEGRPVAYLVDILPEDVLPLRTVLDEFKGSILDLMLESNDFSLTTSRTEINAVAAPSEIARALEIQRGDVVLCFEATLYSAKGRAVDYSHSYYLPGYFKFHVIRRVG